MAVSAKTAGPAAFPRGKRKKKVAEEGAAIPAVVKHKKVKEDSEGDLFRSASSTTKTKADKNKKRDKKGKKSKDTAGGGEDNSIGVGARLKSAESLTYSQLDIGMLILGVVSSVGEYELKVSLPGHLVGTVPITNVSRPYTKALRQIAEDAHAATEAGVRTMKEMFRVGQAVSCAVERAANNDDGFFKVVLSLDPAAVQGHLPKDAVRPGAVMQASVVSVEDHGFVMDIGVVGIKAFLPLKKVEKYVTTVLGGEAPSVGQVLPAVVVRSESSAAVLTCDPAKLKKSLADPGEMSVHTMLPGTCVRAQVKAPVPGGVKVSFGDFSGLVHQDHFGGELEEEETVEARLLYVLPTVNVIYLSCKPHLKFASKSESDPLERFPIGHMIKNAEVVNSGRSGLVVRLSSDGDAALGHVSARQVTEGQIPNLKEKYPAGSSRVTCKVIQFDHADAMYICSMQKSVLEQKVLQSGHLRPGDRVSCKVKSVLPGKGAVVAVGAKSQEAFIPMLHLSDVPLKHPEKKFPPGTKLSCRVLRTDPERRRLHLTNKSILVNEDYAVVSEFSKEHVGVDTEGVVVNVTSDGLLLQLFGDVRGWVPKSRMSVEPIEYPEKLFFLGQVLKCQVVNVEPERKRMTLTLVLGGHHKPLGRKQKREGERVKLGEFYDCTVMDKTSDGLSVEVNANGIITKAFLPKNHLTDHPPLADALLAACNIGDIIEDAICYERDVVPVMSAKPIIKEAAKSGHLPKSFSDLQEGVTVPAVVSTVKPYGVFLRLPTWHFRKSALVPTRLIADVFVEDPSEAVCVHQTVYAKVIDRDEDEEKVTMSMKRKDLPKEKRGITILASLLRDADRAKSGVVLSLFKPGMVVTATVRQVTKLGLEVDAGQGTRGIVTNAGLVGLASRPTVGAHLNCAVLFVDPEYSCLELTASPDIVRRVSARKKKRSAQEGSSAKATVVLVKSELQYITLCVKNGPLSGQFVHLPTREHINDPEGMADQFAVGNVHAVVIKEVIDGHTICLLAREEKGKKRQRSESVMVDEEGAGKKRLSESGGDPPKKAKRSESEMSMTESRKDEEDTYTSESFPDKKEKRDPGWEEDFDPWSKAEARQAGAAADSEANSEPGSPTKKKLKMHISKKEKKLLDKMEAEEIARAEQRVIDGVEDAAEPQTAEEFDRLVMASPNSSLAWIKYMAFHAERKELSMAREVTKRALEKINFREGEDRLNIYLAWLNLENTMGDEESTDGVLQQALKYNDQYAVYTRAAAAFAQGGQMEKAERLYKTMARKFCKEPEAWVRLGTHYFLTGNLKEARFTLQRSIQNLDKKDHVSITSRFGQLEFRLGEVERGKTVFETVLGNYPARTDLWSVYADALVKAGEAEAARAVFERMVGLRLQPKKMKFFFKKYLAFEEAHGDQQGIDRVRKKALEYVETSVGLKTKSE